MSVVLVIRSQRNRFLPMASPILALAILMILVCGAQLLEHLSFDIQLDTPAWVLSLWLTTSILILPIWTHIIGEYKYQQKLPIKHNAWMYIEPLITISVAFYAAFEQNGHIRNLPDLLGDYQPFHFAYMVTVSTFVVAWSVYNVSLKSQRNLSSLFQFGACLALPLLLFLGYRIGLVSKPMGASALVLLLIWAAKESDLLNVIPSAMSGVLRRIDAGVLVFNSQRQLVYRNSSAKQLLQTSGAPDTSLKKTYNNRVTHLDDLPEGVRTAFNFDSEKTQNQLIELPASLYLNRETSDNSKLNNCYLDATLSPIKNDKTQHYLGSILVLKNVSKRVHSELKLAQSNQQLLQLDQQKSDFFAGISHEFRTPLTLSIGGLSDALNGDYGDVSETLSPVLEQAKQNNQRLLRLVAQLLELSRLDSLKFDRGAALLNPQEISLERVLEGVLANFESLAPKQKTKIQRNNQSSSSQLWFDLNSLEKVIMNLVSNALKSIQESGEIIITLADNDTAITLSVKDTGNGIPETVLPHIFKAFYYHDKPHPQWPTGTGIGLYLVKTILDTHGATITVNSTEGEGSEFIVTFIKGHQHLDHLTDIKALAPASNQENVTHLTRDFSDDIELDESAEIPNEVDYYALSESPNTSSKQTNQDSEKLVLVVEDNVQMRRYIRHHLAKEFRLIEAEDGEEGFELAKQSVPDLILSDLMMPTSNGLQMSHNIRSTPATSHIPIILLTAKAEPNDKLDGFKLGIDDYITKPFDATELIVRIHNLIKSRDILRERFSKDFTSSQSIKTSTNSPLLDQESLFLKRLDTYISSNLSNSDLLIADVATEFHMSERSFHRKLNALTGSSPKQYIIKLKMRVACKLLSESDLTISAIALNSGFGGSAQFSRAFKHQYQVSPKEYRDQAKLKVHVNSQ